MTPTQAAKVYRELKPQLADLEKQVAEAKDVLLKHFTKPGAKPEYRGVSFKVAEYQTLDTAKAKEALGKKVADCMRTVTRRTLDIVDA